MGILQMSYLDELVEMLRNGNIEMPQFEARMIAAGVLGINVDTFLFSAPPATDAQIGRMKKMASERLQHRPLCKILGAKGFYKYDFVVNEHVLSPRPDTEVLVEAAIAEAEKSSARTILDLGTGSGCIILSIMGDVPALKGWAVDASSQAMEVARINAGRLGLDSRMSFVNASWFDENLPELLGTKFDIVVSNPPYIPSAEIAELEPEVKDYDPRSALDGGADGLEHYRRIAELCPKILNDGGLIFLEGGLHQENDIAAIFTAKGFKLAKIIPDLAGINRCIFLKK